MRKHFCPAMIQSSIIKKLIIDFFELIEEKELKKNKNSKAKFWVENLQTVNYNDKNYLSVKKATRYYEKYVEDKNNVSVKEPNRYLCDFISEYLGYKNFEEYSLQNKPDIRKNTFLKKVEFKNKLRKNLIYMCGLLIFPLTIFFYNLGKSSNDKCIIWNENNFIKSPCNSIYSINNLIYNIDIEKFQKIEITNKTIFFIQGKPNVWYGKSKNGDYEYFSDRGIHPETLKELKPITKYIIKKYLRSNIIKN